MSDEQPIDRRNDEDNVSAQKLGVRRLSLEERFRQNDSLSRFRVEALRSRSRPLAILRELRELRDEGVP